MIIAKNQVLKLDDDRLVRVLWVDPKSEFAFIFDIESLSVPERISMQELFNSSEPDEDPYAYIFDEKEIPENHKVRRDNRWKVISEIVSEEPEIYMKNQRGLLIQELSRVTGSQKKRIYVNLKQYWQRGMTKNALLPDYNNCGRYEHRDDVAKSGRKRKYADRLGNGVKLTPEIKKIFLKAFKKYNKNAHRQTYKGAYEDMIAEYFREETHSEGDKQLYPSYGQFVRFYHETYSNEEALKFKKGTKKYMKDYRPVLGDSSGEANCPGGQYQIDATIADIYLVSGMNRDWIVGRPVLYFCVDVFTRMVAGFYVGFTGPSLEGARMAILNCAENKVDFCRQYGIEIEPEDWPVQHLPSCFLGDNGEMRGYTPENAIRRFNIDVSNTASYRPDMKGIVERRFRTVNEKVKPVLPGFVLPDYSERGGHDYRLDAVLNLDEFTKILILLILEHHDRILRKYPIDDDLAGDGVILSPKELWKWGVRNRAGALRTVPQDQLKASLLPHKNAVVTSSGIKLHNDVHYDLPLAKELGWFHRGQGQKPKKVQLAYNPRNLNEAYILHDNEYIPAIPTPASNAAKYNIEDIEYYTEYMQYQKDLASKKDFQRQALIKYELKSIIDTASLDNEISGTAKKKNVKSIRDHRKAEVIRLNNKASDLSVEKQPEKPERNYDDSMFDMLEQVWDEDENDE